MKQFRAILIGLVVGCYACTLPAQTIDGINAVVHDSVITFKDVRDLTLQVFPTLQEQYGNDREKLQQAVAKASEENLEQLVDRQLILHDFEASGYNLPDSIIEEAVRERIRKDYGTRARLIRTLQAKGISLEKFRQSVRDQFIIAALQSRNVSSEIMISPHKIEVYYQQHTNDFRVEDQVKLRMIVLTNSPATEARIRQLGNEILSQIKEGAKFADMASVYSQGSQRQDGGNWGWVERSVLRKELADVAFSLPVGTPSQVIELPGADYIMLVEDRRPAHIKPLNDVRDDIERVLLNQENARLQKQWIDGLRKKTFIMYF